MIPHGHWGMAVILIAWQKILLGTRILCLFLLCMWLDYRILHQVIRQGHGGRRMAAPSRAAHAIFCPVFYPLFSQPPSYANDSMVDSKAPEDDGAVYREGPGAWFLSPMAPSIASTEFEMSEEYILIMLGLCYLLKQLTVLILTHTIIIRWGPSWAIQGHSRPKPCASSQDAQQQASVSWPEAGGTRTLSLIGACGD